MEMDYAAMEQEVQKLYGESKVMVLATSYQDRVTARPMSCIFQGLKILFQMGTETTKAQQIMQNPQVALCFANCQIEGTAALIGHPYDVTYFKETYQKHHPGSFKAYSGMTIAQVVEVTPTRISMWKYDEEGKPFIDSLDIPALKATREYYDTSR